MGVDRRFKGVMSQNYLLVRHAIPDVEATAEAIAVVLVQPPRLVQSLLEAHESLVLLIAYFPVASTALRSVG